VVVEVDEPRSDDQASAVDRLANLAGDDLADGDDLVADDRHVAGLGGRTCAVEDLSPAEKDVGVDGGGGGTLGLDADRTEPNRCSGNAASNRPNRAKVEFIP